MQKIEIQAHSLEEAKLIAFQAGITVVQDATKNWKKAGSPILTKDLNIYAADFLEEKGMFDFKGAGIIITITSGVEDTRKNPFKINSVRRKGRCQLKRVIEIRTQKDNQLLGTASRTKFNKFNRSNRIIKRTNKEVSREYIWENCILF